MKTPPNLSSNNQTTGSQKNATNNNISKKISPGKSSTYRKIINEKFKKTKRNVASDWVDVVLSEHLSIYFLFFAMGLLGCVFV